MTTFYRSAASARAYLPALAYLACVLFFGYSAMRQMLSHYYGNSAFISGSYAEAERAILYEPENPDAHKVQGLLFDRNGDFANSANSFEAAIKLRPNNYLLWLRLGYARRQLKDFNGARSAYEKAIELAPNYSQTNYYMGKMLLDLGDYDEAFAYLRKAGENDLALYPEIRHLARLAYPADGPSIENALQPESLETKRSVAHYLIKYHFMTDEAKAFLLGDELTPAEKDEFIKYLIHKENFALAREVWASKIKTAAALDAPIYDGGFEAITESDASGLGWQIDQRMSATAVSRDTKTLHSGAASVYIKFAGGVELGRPIVSQLAFITPGRRYSLSYFVRSAEMISAGLPAIVVTDGLTNEPLASSAPIQNTSDEWVQQTMDFTAKDASVVLISLQRPACSTSPCPIFGDLSLDDISVTETQ